LELANLKGGWVIKG